MRFSSIRIQNFRAIAQLTMDDLNDLVVIAGANGSGKSCVFDALRLLKSAYGSYATNEYMMWFGEFLINPNDSAMMSPLFRDKSKDVVIAATMQLDESERQYLQVNAERVLEPQVWMAATSQPLEQYGYSAMAYAGAHPHLVPQVSQIVERQSGALREALAEQSFELQLTIPANPEERLQRAESPVASAIFGTYTPTELGILDYHSASRNYAREGLGGVNMDFRSIEITRRASSLYNAQNKYANVKSELAATYLRSVVAERQNGGTEDEAFPDLNETMQELFTSFFPDKKYLGVNMDTTGNLIFPVEVSDGITHDINELSSGEKEVLYGYLRLRNATPRHSVILLDEPELHLNPGLLQGFPDFYYKNLVQLHDNQLWLVTHSDALLRQAVGNPAYSVFHLHNASVVEGDNQASPIGEDDLQLAVIDLVGDVASFAPYAKVIVFEGEPGSDFDVRMVRRLFPKIVGRANLISGRSKGRVQDLYATLAGAADQTGMARKYYAVVDRDSDPSGPPDETTQVFAWNAYHIENFLLDAETIAKVVAAIDLDSAYASPQEVLNGLQAAAKDLVDDLTLRALQKHVNDLLVKRINIGGSSKSSDVVQSLLPSIQGSLERIEAARESVTESALTEWSTTHRGKLLDAIADGTWVTELPGRDILKRFVSHHLSFTLSYDIFVNLIITRMVESGVQPSAMKATLVRIVPGL